MSKTTIKNMIEKANHANKVNPGNKHNKYQPKPRPRSTKFELKTAYKRARVKDDARKDKYDY